MLINMHVTNLALIEETDVDFTDHLNILTGETGAGKSILIGSIQSALGGKIPKDMIRDGKDSALIELVFQTDSRRVLDKLEEYDIPCEEGEIIIQRRVTKGRILNKINDNSVTRARLKEIAPLLLDLSGQHENQLLLNPVNHREILDSYAAEEIQPAREKVQSLYLQYSRLKRELSEKAMGEDERLRELEFIQYEIREIEQANLRDGEDEELEEQYTVLSHAMEILEDAGSVQEMTSAGQNNAADLIGRSAARLSSLETLDPNAADLIEQLSTIDSLLNDFNRDLATYIDAMEYDSDSLSQVEERLDQINHMKARYGGSIPGIRAYYKDILEKQDKLLHYEEYLSDLNRQFEKVSGDLERASEDLTTLRKKAAKPLVEAIKTALIDLNFPDVAFELSFDRTDHFTAQGRDEVCFMISTNPGQAMRPLHEIASGGELSRIMLAIKSILADEEQIETLIFDEIDTGISGRTAQKVSEKLSRIARSRQVIAITHLPQIAAMADAHYLIEKTSDDTKTISNIYPLDEEESVVELARMLSGAKVTDAVLENAREMKALADIQKK